MNTLDSQGESSGECTGQTASIKEHAPLCFRINEPSVIYQTFDREVVAVHLNTGSYHTLPGIAGEVFLLLGSTGAATRDVAAELATKYDAPVEVIAQDLDLFAGQLLQQSMIVAVDGAVSIVSSPAPVETLRLPYTAPRLESFNDLEGLVLIDPVHDVGTAGWPNVAPEPFDESALEPGDTCVLSLMRCRIAGPNVIFERFGAETVAMDLGTGAYHSLSGLAEEIFLLFPQEPTTWEIRSALEKRYTVEEAELETALRDYLNQLAHEGLIVLEKLDEAQAATLEQRQLAMSSENVGEPFDPPKLETFAQPSFDGTFGEEMTFSHEQTGQSQSGDEYGAAREPNAKRRYAIRSGDLVYSTSGGETVISDRDEGKYLKLNEAASDVFRLLLHKPDVGTVVSALQQKYAVREHDLRVSVMILLWNLRKVGLVALEKGHAGELTPEPLPVLAVSATTPFTGFDVAMHRDLKDLLRPFNIGHPGLLKPKITHARQFAMLLEEYFDEAAGASGPSRETYSVGHLPLTVQCVEGSHASELRRAFAHLRSDESVQQQGSGLTISAWSHESTSPGPLLAGVLARLFENWSVVCGPRGEFLDFHCEEISAIYHPGPDILSVLDRENRKAFYLLRDDCPLPFWEQSSPFRHILHPWFDRCGLQYTHAGAVGGPNGGVLFAGKGGSGKSTTSILCASAGMLYAADDYCLTRSGDGQVFSLYNTAKLKGPEDLERLPEMSGLSFNVDSFEHGGIGKGAFSLSDIWPERMASGFPLRAILLPTVTDKVDSRIEPCSSGEALLALTPSTVAQLPLSGQADCLRLAELAEKVPAYRLYLGSDLAQVPRLIGELAG